MDYKALREAGIAHIQKLAGHLWTDHNSHDPGITILEQVCFALTDLNYRTGFEIQDLVAEAQSQPEWFRPGEVLTTAPVTLKDLRKSLIDVHGVRNVWIFPENSNYKPLIYYDDTDRSLSLENVGGQGSESEVLPLKGLYRILVATSALVDADARREVLNNVRVRFHENRGLCEDLASLDLIEDESVGIKAEIEIGKVHNPEAIMAQIFQRIYNHISPSLQFYSLTERLEAGLSIEEIMEGPALNHGFIDDVELERFKLRRHLRVSDLIRVIMEDPEVLAVRSIDLGNSMTKKPLGDWTYSIAEGKAPVWFPSFGQNFKNLNTPFILLREGLPVRLNWKRVERQFNLLIRRNSAEELALAHRDVILSPGRDRNVGHYDSIQFQFPDVYGIGQHGLAEAGDPVKKTQVHQLKGYLCFLDQILANYFAQLGHAHNLFSHDWSTSGMARSYQFKPLFNAIPHYEKLLVDLHDKEDENEFEANYEEFHLRMQQITEDPDHDQESDDSEAALLRKNRFLNHLMARFAEQMTDYSLDLVGEMDGSREKEQIMENKLEEMAENKSLFLKEYPLFSGRQGTAFNYTKESWNTENISGLKRRLCRSLGIRDARNIALSEISNEHFGGFHLLEHILLRARGDQDVGDKRQGSAFLRLPFTENENTPPQKDPYSLQLSFIFPNWLTRFQSSVAQQSVLKLLREETPAHIRINLIWLSIEEMNAFESNFRDWLEELKMMG